MKWSRAERNKTLFEEIGEIIQPPFKLNEVLEEIFCVEMNFSPLDYTLTPEEKVKYKFNKTKERKQKNNEWNLSEQKYNKYLKN